MRLAGSVIGCVLLVSIHVLCYIQFQYDSVSLSEKSRRFSYNSFSECEASASNTTAMINPMNYTANNGSAYSSTSSIPVNDTTINSVIVNGLNSSSALEEVTTDVLVKRNTTSNETSDISGGKSGERVDGLKEVEGVVEEEDDNDGGKGNKKGDDDVEDDNEDKEVKEDEKGNDGDGDVENEREKVDEKGNDDEDDVEDKGDEKDQKVKEDEKGDEDEEDKKDKGDDEDTEDKKDESNNENNEVTQEDKDNETTKETNSPTPPPSNTYTLPPNTTVHSRKKQRPKTRRFRSRMSYQTQMARRSVQKVLINTALPAPPVLAHSRNSSRYSLVLFTTADYHPNYKQVKILNVLRMFSVFQSVFSFRGVVFTRTSSLAHAAKKLGITVVTEYPLNPYKMPIVSSMFVKATSLFDSDYYGYINSDILLTANLFQYLELCRLNAERGNINKRHEIAGRVQEIERYHLIKATTLPAYMAEFKKLAKQPRQIRHPHSADYFIFSRYFNFSELLPVVIGRKKVDNYLLWIPQQPPTTEEDARYCRKEWVTKGHLIDLTYGVMGLHLGVDTYFSKERKEHTLPNDKLWNLRYFKNIDGHHASLFYAHYTFRYLRNALNWYYQNVSSLYAVSLVCSKQKDITIHSQTQIAQKHPCPATHVDFDRKQPQRRRWSERKRPPFGREPSSAAAEKAHRTSPRTCKWIPP